MKKYSYFLSFFLLLVSINLYADFSRQQSVILKNSAPSQQQFIVITDIHFDPFVSCKNSIPCPLIQQLYRASVAQWPKLLTEYDHFNAAKGKDTGYQLLKKSLIAANKVAQLEHAQFVMVLGDFLGHQYNYYFNKYSKDHSQKAYKQFIKKTFLFLANELHESFPNINVYPAIGNNDSYVGDYVSIPNDVFFQDFASAWKPLLNHPNLNQLAKKELSHNGYYSQNISPVLKLIVLNTNFFSYKAHGKNNSNAAITELSWLKQQLLNAKKNNQQVIIGMHIPMQIDLYINLRDKLFSIWSLWDAKYINIFSSLLQEFSPQISAILTGHLHFATFHYATYGAHEIPMLGTAAISPIFGNDPAFNLLSYSQAPFSLQSYSTYSSPISSIKSLLH